MELNETADLDTSQVEDMRGSGSAGGGGGGFRLPGRGGGVGGLGGGGQGGTGGPGGMIPGLSGGKLGTGTIVLIALCLGAFLCLGGGEMGLGSLGDLRRGEHGLRAGEQRRRAVLLPRRLPCLH